MFATALRPGWPLLRPRVPCLRPSATGASWSAAGLCDRDCDWVLRRGLKPATRLTCRLRSRIPSDINGLLTHEGLPDIEVAINGLVEQFNQPPFHTTLCDKGEFGKFQEACKDMVKYIETQIKALVGARRALQRMIGSVAPCRK